MNDWRTDAACRGLGPSLFYPDDVADQAVIHGARRICNDCPVTRDCLDTALADGELYGVWAGTGPRERMAMRRRRGIARAGNYVTRVVVG